MAIKFQAELDRAGLLCDTYADRFLTPEEKLLVGIFDRALRDLLMPSKSVPHKDLKSARDYFITKRKGYGSLRYICEVLEIDADRLVKLIFSDTDRILELLNNRSRGKNPRGVKGVRPNGKGVANTEES